MVLIGTSFPENISNHSEYFCSNICQNLDFRKYSDVVFVTRNNVGVSSEILVNKALILPHSKFLQRIIIDHIKDPFSTTETIKIMWEIETETMMNILNILYMGKIKVPYEALKKILDGFSQLGIDPGKMDFSVWKVLYTEQKPSVEIPLYFTEGGRLLSQDTSITIKEDTEYQTESVEACQPPAELYEPEDHVEMTLMSGRQTLAENESAAVDSPRVTIYESNLSEDLTETPAKTKKRKRLDMSGMLGYYDNSSPEMSDDSSDDFQPDGGQSRSLCSNRKRKLNLDGSKKKKKRFVKRKSHISNQGAENEIGNDKPVKRKPGRPPKNPLNLSGSEISLQKSKNSPQEEGHPEKVKRSPGRPRKNIKCSDSTPKKSPNAPQEEGQLEKVKRSPGRPRKNIINCSEFSPQKATNTLQEMGQLKIVKRSPGRPKKNITNYSELSPARSLMMDSAMEESRENDSIVKTVIGGVAENRIGEDKAIKRKPGRPPKNQLNSVESGIAKTPVTPSPQPEQLRVGGSMKKIKQKKLTDMFRSSPVRTAVNDNKENQREVGDSSVATEPSESGSKDTQVSLDCPKCTSAFPNQSNLRLHLALEHYSEKIKAVNANDYCVKCQKTFTGQILVHVAMCHKHIIKFFLGKEGLVLPREEGPLEQTEEMHYYYDAADFPPKPVKIDLKKIRTKTLTQCFLCQEEFGNDREEIIKHLLQDNEHYKPELLSVHCKDPSGWRENQQCPECTKYIPEESSFILHMAMEHDALTKLIPEKYRIPPLVGKSYRIKTASNKNTCPVEGCEASRPDEMTMNVHIICSHLKKLLDTEFRKELRSGSLICRMPSCRTEFSVEGSKNKTDRLNFYKHLFAHQQLKEDYLKMLTKPNDELATAKAQVDIADEVEKSDTKVEEEQVGKEEIVLNTVNNVNIERSDEISKNAIVESEEVDSNRNVDDSVETVDVNNKEENSENDIKENIDSKENISNIESVDREPVVISSRESFHEQAKGDDIQEEIADNDKNIIENSD